MSEVKNRNGDLKIMFFEPSEEAEVDRETVWATALGNDLYRINNLPLHIAQAALGDVVYAPFDDYEKCPVVEEVVERSGNRAAWILFNDKVKPGSGEEAILDHLVSLGCSYEGEGNVLFGLTIPPSADLVTVTGYLSSQKGGFAYWLSILTVYELIQLLVGDEESTLSELVKIPSQSEQMEKLMLKPTVPRMDSNEEKEGSQTHSNNP